MINQALSMKSPTPPSFLRRHCRVCIGLFALCATLQSPPSLAAQRTAQVLDQSEYVEPIGIYWLSGGIGDEEREEMQQAAPDYNVHLTFINRRGEYLADIPVAIATPRGQILYSGVSEGPLLYLRLPPGDYDIYAEIDGKWQTKHIHAGRTHASKVTFVAQQ